MIMLTTSKYVLPLTSIVQNVCQKCIKRHISKADRIKRLMREYKLMFGELVETNAEKKRRLKLERKGKIPQQKPNETNAELSWIMKNSGKHLKKINLPTKPQNELVDSDKFNNVKIETPNQNIEHGFHSESDPALQKVEPKITNQPCNLSTVITDINNIPNENIPNLSTTENTKYDVPSNFERLPDIIIKNLPSFPIIGNKQKSSTQLTEVLSISGQDDPETIKFPSVTRILAQTMPLESKMALEAWKERMVKKLGPEGFEMHQKGIKLNYPNLNSNLI